MVSLGVEVGLHQMRPGSAAREQVSAKGRALLAELGSEAAPIGRWDNGVGQMGMYVTARGLQYLASSGNASSFQTDVTDSMRVRVPSFDGRLAAIEQALDTSGVADVEVALNVASFGFQWGRDGAPQYSAADPAERRSVMEQLLALLDASMALNLSDLRAAQSAGPPTVDLRITQNGFRLLRESTLVRSIRLKGITDSRPTDLEADALAVARRHGSVEVIVELRGGHPYSPAEGYMAPQAWRAQAKANRAALLDILGDGAVITADLSSLGAMAARVTPAALSRVYAARDPRVLSVRRNRALLEPSLTTSTVLTNMPAAWGAGYRAAGQTIVIYDSGVRRDHLFMDGKITNEFCAGTDDPDSPLRSICPGRPPGDLTGDSPLGVPGAGEPPSLIACPPAFPDARYTACTHGTHVAGIAAGRNNGTFTPGLQGIAPDAAIIAAQVFSFDPANVVTGRSFRADFLLGLDTLFSQSVGDAYVANLSLGQAGSRWQVDCDPWDQTFAAAIARLNSRNIPVVFATGNDFYNTLPGGSGLRGINWPACHSNTIKVASTDNAGTGDQLSAFSNLGDPANFTGGFFLAPGNIVVSSLNASATTFGSMGGTSQAAPHVAGYAAAVKAGAPGITNADLIAWMRTTGSVPVMLNGVEHRRIRAPF